MCIYIYLYLFIHTVDGGNPGPAGMVETLEKIG